MTRKKILIFIVIMIGVVVWAMTTLKVSDELSVEQVVYVRDIYQAGGRFHVVLDQVEGQGSVVVEVSPLAGVQEFYLSSRTDLILGQGGKDQFSLSPRKLHSKFKSLDQGETLYRLPFVAVTRGGYLVSLTEIYDPLLN
ncbi:MAG: hypothetical protein A2589_01540 [Candidatus Vogelbacteria bacterium RIFOXYD1_FULL_46_19]|uniref:Uncharacterized protein n=1 Tax=Candidatus Vogelbacteria bacterium RIFOXYD1_FULL_46_19 TaxID=1802439 RepID=A0A1G2QG36_9BACT|nr:MAG: hypothetical protein A2589_01540 [Candidatus Vogelbacteria bacterium RIFOXYD1_FULL_46_19]